MKTETANPKPDRDVTGAHSCCGNTQKQRPKQTAKETRCGCGDKHTKPVTESPCCK